MSFCKIKYTILIMEMHVSFNLGKFVHLTLVQYIISIKLKVDSHWLF